MLEQLWSWRLVDVELCLSCFPCTSSGLHYTSNKKHLWNNVIKFQYTSETVSSAIYTLMKIRLLSSNIWFAHKYCIVSIHLYSTSCSARQSEALPVLETQREETPNVFNYVFKRYGIQHYNQLSCHNVNISHFIHSHDSLTIAGLRAPLSRFLEGVLYKYPEWMNEEWLDCPSCL